VTRRPWRPVCLYHGMGHTSLAVGRVTVLVLWSLWWRRHPVRPWGLSVVSGAGALRLGPFWLVWRARG
jgi:hypothetical protein